MPKWRVANVYVIRCIHEVEADTEDEAIRRGMDQHDEMNIGMADYSHTEIKEEIKEE